VVDQAGAGLPLLEREGELCLLDRLVQGVLSGRGGSALVEGLPGVGKTSLLAYAGDRMRAGGGRVVLARAAELEQGFPFGVVRQLFESALHRRSTADLDGLLRGAELAGRLLLRPPNGAPEEVTGTVGDALFGSLHALYWLAVNLSDEAPVLLLVDDLHWADEPSRRYVAFCGARLADLPIGIAVTYREGTRASDEMQILRGLPETLYVQPTPLSSGGVACVLGDMLGADADTCFAEACWQATGGVPFYVRELARELARQGIPPVAPNAVRVVDVHPQSLDRTIVARMGVLPEPASRVARAVAVLGGPAETGMVAGVAGVSLLAVGRAHQQLAEAGILDAHQLAFRHPIITGSVYASIPLAERERLHATAAGLLQSAGAPTDQVAVQLLHSPAKGNAWVVEVLRRAATEAMARGVSGEAVALLNRALREPPAEGIRADVLLELGTAEHSAGLLHDAIAHLKDALDVARPILRPRVALVLGPALSFAGRLDEAAELANRVGAEVQTSDPELALRLDLDFMMVAGDTMGGVGLMLARVPAVTANADPSSHTGRLALGYLAMHGTKVNDPAWVVADRARRALGGGDLIVGEPPDSALHWPALHALILVDDFELASRGIARLAAEAQRLGSIGGLAIARILGALLGLQRGALRDAEVDAWEALSIARTYQEGFLPFAVSLVADALTERGDLDRAEELLAEPILSDFAGHVGFLHAYLAARGNLLMARRRWREALDTLLDLGRRHVAWHASSPATLDWRSRAALAALALGDHDQAAVLAAEELRLAEAFGAPRPVAVALHAVALIEGGEQGRCLLDRALEVLRGRGTELVEARVHTDLGLLLRDRGDIDAARDHLRAGLDLAVRCGATPVAERARRELVAAGARPRRSVLVGADALTATERRISQLAAQGLSNREIAQALFVTVKTVELHLTNAYRKLQVTGRGQLATVLTTSA
jgi:DNA-binding CsgD family transcriptional regulator